MLNVIKMSIQTISDLIPCYDSGNDESDKPTDSGSSLKEVLESCKKLSANVNTKN